MNYGINLIGLNSKSIDDAIRQLRYYENNIFAIKLKNAMNRIMQAGIKVAVVNTEYGKYITLYKDELQGTEDEAIMLLSAVSPRILSQWISYDGSEEYVESVMVSPILMEEFGSGNFAIEPDNPLINAGRGTLDIKGHSDEPYWHWKDLDGKWHTTSGYQPSRPLTKAMNEMLSVAKSIIRQEFG